jgi:hypothetical protein
MARTMVRGHLGIMVSAVLLVPLAQTLLVLVPWPRAEQPTAMKILAWVLPWSGRVPSPRPAEGESGGHTGVLSAHPFYWKEEIMMQQPIAQLHTALDAIPADEPRNYLRQSLQLLLPMLELMQQHLEVLEGRLEALESRDR